MDKTACMIFSRKKTVSEFSYEINNINLKVVSEFKYLGIFFTFSLHWSRHVDYTVAKASKSLGFLCRNMRNFPQVTRELLFKTNVLSILEYACTVWDPPTITDRDKLERVQNFVARYVLGRSEKDRF